MDYIARLRRDPEDGVWLITTFADCPGCQTDADTRAEAIEAARDALSGWLEAHLVGGRVPPPPRPGRRGARIPVGARLSAALQIRWWRDEHDLTQAELARRAKVSQQQIAKLENPDANPSLATLEKVADAMGGRLALTLAAALSSTGPVVPNPEVARHAQAVNGRARSEGIASPCSSRSARTRRASACTFRSASSRVLP